ncbi:hypothetical protein M9H77_27796 [Catharanthus roseus]|uniref:Uncharacterized protein n=1 Tax=Catharanthus roseus TaxID=4058 RepID=A0ACC0AHU4_CATRO|nr:hypothetical protein M9H77_27796 [Catharanthus roseus]
MPEASCGPPPIATPHGPANIPSSVSQQEVHSSLGLATSSTQHFQKTTPQQQDQAAADTQATACKINPQENPSILSTRKSIRIKNHQLWGKKVKKGCCCCKCRQKIAAEAPPTPTPTPRPPHFHWFSAASLQFLVLSLMAVLRTGQNGTAALLLPLGHFGVPQSGYSSPAQSGIERDLDMSTAEYSIFGSLLTFGSMLGAIISGIVADFIGRRGDAWWLDLGRFLLGFSNGLQLYVSVIYIAEITPKEFRGGFAMAIQLMVCGGVVLMFFMGNIVSWRILALIGTVPCLIQVIGVLFIPESPRWLAKVGLRKQLEASLRLLRGRDADISQEATQIWDSTRQFEEQPRSGLWQLVERRYARPLIVGIGLSLLVPWGGITGILFYASSIFAAADTILSFRSPFDG